jgi:hypothetical protein
MYSRTGETGRGTRRQMKDRKDRKGEKRTGEGQERPGERQ